MPLPEHHIFWDHGIRLCVHLLQRTTNSVNGDQQQYINGIKDNYEHIARTRIIYAITWVYPNFTY